jgi:hypothetical protein
VDAATLGLLTKEQGSIIFEMQYDVLQYGGAKAAG